MQHLAGTCGSNSDKNNKTAVRIDVKWGGACTNDTFTLQPGYSKRISAGLCDVTSVHVDYPWGEDLIVTKATGNPVNGVRIITINKGLKNEKYKVVRNEDLPKYGIMQ